MHIAEDVELVKAGEHVEEQVDDEEHDAVGPRQTPAVDMYTDQ